jgi:flagellar biosynthesis protein FlhF
MRLKTFYAKTMTEAMQMVRETLGEDAIIVSTGEEQGGKVMRVVAAIEPAFEISREGVAASDSWLQYDEEQDVEAIAEELTDMMLRHAVSEDVMDRVISCATVMGFEEIGIALVATLEQLFNFTPLPTKAHKKPIMMVGAPGAGKTLAVAKMAARSTMNGLDIGVISTDTLRAGGIEQLQAFTNLLDVDLHKAATPKDLRMMVEDMSRHCDQILIDTSGLNPFSTDDVKILAKFIGAIDARPVLVLPAGIDADEAGEMARVFSTIGATDILPTRVDIARRLGSLLTAAHQGNLNFSDVSNTPKVAQGLAPLTPKALSRLLMPRAFAEKARAQTDFTENTYITTGMKKTGTRQ